MTVAEFIIFWIAVLALGALQIVLLLVLVYLLVGMIVLPFVWLWSLWRSR